VHNNRGAGQLLGSLFAQACCRFRLGGELTIKPNIDAGKRAKIQSPSWLDSDEDAFLKHAIKFSVPTKAEFLIENGFGGEFAARLLRHALKASEYQTEYWKIVTRLWPQNAWRLHLRKAGAKGDVPSPSRFSSLLRPVMARTLLGLYGKDVLAWCLSAFLISAGTAAEQVAQTIIGQKFKQRALIEAIRPALEMINAAGESYPRGLSSKIIGLLSRIDAAPATPRQPKTIMRVHDSLILTHINAKMLINIFLSEKKSDSFTKGDNLANALAETAWIEADDGLARALQQTPALRQAMRGQPELGTAFRNQLGVVIQAVRSSAAKRQIDIEGEPGSEVQFDPAKHSRDDPRVEAAQRVRIIAPTVYQGRGQNRRVLRTADVEPI
jgi:hypothetical protein